MTNCRSGWGSDRWSDPGTDPARILARLGDGYLSTQLLYVATALGIPDALADGPAAAGDLAAAVGASPGPLHRVLRGLAAEGVLDELPDGRFGLSPIGALLVEGAPGSQRGAVLARGSLYYAALGELLGTVCGGRAAFELVHGTSFFEHLAARPAGSTAFRASMAARSAREAAAVVAGDRRRLLHRRAGRCRCLPALPGDPRLPTAAGVSVLEAHVSR